MLLICKTCGGKVSSSSDSCLHCGEDDYRRNVTCDLCNGVGEYTDKVYIDGKESAIYKTITIRCPGCWGKGISTEGYSRLEYKPGNKYHSLIKDQYFIRAQIKGNKKGVDFRNCPTCKGSGRYRGTGDEIICPSCLGSGSAVHLEPKKGCFITTAVCTFQNKADDCYELEILRKFRDEYLRKKYSNEIIKYYEISPKIVDLINESSQKKEIYTDIRKEINKCIYFIENKEYEMAFEIYKKMFLKLKIDFILVS